VEYFITVTNYGPSTASNVIVLDSLPTSVSFVSATTTLGSVDRTGLNINWTVGNLVTNAGGQLTLTVQANSVGEIYNTATVSSDTPDPNPDDSTASTIVSVGVSTPPQLSGSLTGAGGIFQFNVTGQSGQEYIIQASTNLLDWVPIYTNPAPYVSPFNFVDPNASSYTSRFYRVVAAP
jgi:uncharacterized repeat protein (TIGR01451 family)